jgi:hypothetical protein
MSPAIKCLILLAVVALFFVTEHSFGNYCNRWRYCVRPVRPDSC